VCSMTCDNPVAVRNAGNSRQFQTSELIPGLQETKNFQLDTSFESPTLILPIKALSNFDN